MSAFQSLSDSEMEIMTVVWDGAEPVTSARLLELFADRAWKTQTVNTFLTRLVSKGVLRMERQGRGNVYFPAVSRQDYHRREARHVVDSMYHGSVQDFLAAFYGGEKIASDELEGLRQWFDKEARRD